MALETRPEHTPIALVMYAVSTLTLLGAAGISPILPVLMADLAITEAQAGLIMTAYTLPVIFVSPLVGWLADRFGRRPPMLVGLFVFGLAGAAVFFVSEFRTILALRLLQGVGYSGVSPLTITVLGDLFEGDTEAGAQGLRVVAVNLGGFVFPIVTGALAGIAWNVPFLLFLLAVPAGLLVLYWFPELDEGDADETGADETGADTSGATETATGGADSDVTEADTGVADVTEADTGDPDVAEYLPADLGHAGSVLATIRRPVVAATLALGFVRFFTAYGVFTFLPFLVTSEGIGVGQVGLVIGIIGGTKMLVASQSRRSFGLGPPVLTMAAALFAGGVLIVTFVTASTLPLFVVLAGVYGLSEGVIAPLQKSVLTQNAAQHVRASVVSVNAVLKNVGKTAAPVVVGALVASRGLTDGFVFLGLGGALVCGAILVTFVVGPDRWLTTR